jgi:Dolichyl-phosphate-mannose-protein mannosyltransferase
LAEIDTVGAVEVVLDPEPAPQSLAARWCACLPEALPVAVAGFGLPAMVLLLLGWFEAPVVGMVGVAGAVGAVGLLGPERLVSFRYGRPKWTVAALVLVGAFAAFNAAYATQDLYAERDPSTYIATGQWLAHHTALPVDTQDEVFRADVQSKLFGYSAGFGDDLLQHGHVAAQGNHLLPALLAVVSWYAGEERLLMLNCLLGAVALLAAFGLVRRLAGDGFALAATAALAVSLPMLEFSRDSYTEPLALLLLFGGLSVLWRAVESGRTAEFGLAGLTAGASALARIDGVLPVLAFVAVGYCYVGRAKPGERRAAAARTGALFGGLIVPVVLGYVDVSRLSSAYYTSRRIDIVSSLRDVAFVAAVGLPVVVLVWLLPRLRAIITAPWRPKLATAAAAVVPVAFVVLAARPLWEVGRERPDPGQPCNALVIALQRRLGLPDVQCRSYDEYTVHWIAWYFGWPMVVLGALGLALLIRRTLRDADLRLLGVASMTAAMALVYLHRSLITPDQVWAMRRYLPVVLPGLLGAAAYLLSRLADRPWPFARQGALGLAVVLVAIPAAITHPMETVRQDGGELAQIRLLCRQVGDAGAVLAVGDGSAANYLQTVRSSCRVPAEGLSADEGQLPPDQQSRQLAVVRSDLAKIRRAALEHGRTLVVISESPTVLPWTGLTPAPLYTLDTRRWDSQLMGVPQGTGDVRLRLWLAEVLPDGSVRAPPPR